MKFLFFTLFLLPQLTWAFQCGVYEFKGIIRVLDGQNVVKIHEDSLKEVVFTLDADLEELAKVNIDEHVTVIGYLYKPVEKFRGHIATQLNEKELKELRDPSKPLAARFMRNDIARRVIDPLHPDQESGYKMLKTSKCRK